MASRLLPALRSSLVLGMMVAIAPACGGEDDREPRWSYISPAIVVPNCATSSCHSESAAVAGLDLSTAEKGFISLRQLHLPPQRQQLPRPLVQPANPDQSRVVHMLRGEGARRMPPDRPLAEADVALIERWILNGALDD